MVTGGNSGETAISQSKRDTTRSTGNTSARRNEEKAKGKQGRGVRKRVNGSHSLAKCNEHSEAGSTTGRRWRLTCISMHLPRLPLSFAYPTSLSVGPRSNPDTFRATLLVLLVGYIREETLSRERISQRRRRRNRSFSGGLDL